MSFCIDDSDQKSESGKIERARESLLTSDFRFVVVRWKDCAAPWDIVHADVDSASSILLTRASLKSIDDEEKAQRCRSILFLHFSSLIFSPHCIAEIEHQGSHQKWPSLFLLSTEIYITEMPFSRIDVLLRFNLVRVMGIAFVHSWTEQKNNELWLNSPFSHRFCRCQSLSYHHVFSNATFSLSHQRVVIIFYQWDD